MNQAEKKALERYQRNQTKTLDLCPLALCQLAKEQDRLYQVIHYRADKKMREHHE